MTTTSFTSTFSLLTLLLLTATTATTAAAAASTNVLYLSPTPTTATCISELVSFSVCLPYTAEPPNNSSSSASSDCCDNFVEIIASGNGTCLCSLLDEPLMFGFPLNSTRILSLSSVCPLPPRLRNVAIFRNYTLQSFCSDVEASPPVMSPGRQGNRNYPDSSDLSPGSAPASAPAPVPCPLHSIESRPLTDGYSLPPPTAPRGFHFVTSEVSSATRIMQPWSWILPVLSRLLSVCPVQQMLQWFC